MDGGKWPNLTDLVIRGLKIRANAQYLPPTNVVGELQRPVAVIKPTSLQLESPIVAARWATGESFHKVVVARRRSYKKAKHRESKSGEHSSSASKGRARAQSESEAHTLSESADEWTRFRRAADEAAAAPSSQAKAPGSKKGKGSKGSAGLKDSKSSASAVAKAGSAKGSKRKGKEAGLAEKPRWDTSFKIPKRSLPDTSVSSGGQRPTRLTSSSVLLRRPLKRAPSLKQARTLKPRQGKGRPSRSPRPRLTYLSATGLTIAQETIPYPLTLSALSGLVAWCSFMAPDTILCCHLRQSVKLGVKRINDSGCGARNSFNMSVRA